MDEKEKEIPPDKCPCYAKLKELEMAFPDGPVLHREAHIAWLKAKQAEAEFWDDLKLDLAKNGVRGLLVLVSGLIIVGLSVKLGLHLPN